MGFAQTVFGFPSGKAYAAQLVKAPSTWAHRFFKVYHITPTVRVPMHSLSDCSAVVVLLQCVTWAGCVRLQAPLHPSSSVASASLHQMKLLYAAQSVLGGAAGTHIFDRGTACSCDLRCMLVCKQVRSFEEQEDDAAEAGAGDMKKVLVRGLLCKGL